MPSKHRRQLIAAGFGRVKLLRSRFEAKGEGAQRAGLNWCVRRRDQSDSSVHAFPAQERESADLSDDESLFNRILSSSSKELKGQSAYPTQAVRKFYESGSTDQTEVDDIEPSNIQPTNKGYSFLTPRSPDDSDHDLETFTEHELDVIGDIVLDNASVYADVWTTEAYFVLELSHMFKNSKRELGAVYGVIAILIGLLPTVDHLEPHVQDVEDSLSENDFDHTPRAYYNNCPGYFAPVLESDANSILADDGSCFTDGEESHHEALIRKIPGPSLRDVALSISSGFDHTKHPAFRGNFEENTISISTNDVSCISHGKAHHENLFDESSARRIRDDAPSIWAEIDQKHPAFSSSVEQDSSNTQETSPQISCEIPTLFASDETDNGSRVFRTSTAHCSAIPDSPTLGGNLSRITWYSGSLSCSEERFLSDEAPILAPLRFTPLSTEYEGYFGNEISRSSSSLSHHCTNLDLQASFSSKGNRELFPSQPEVQDDDADFLYGHSLEGELDETLHDGLDEWFAAGRENKDGTEDDDTMDDGPGDHGFSEAFLSSPLCPSNDRISPRMSTNFEPLPGNIVTVRGAKATQDFAEALDDDYTAPYDDYATSAREDNSQVCIDSIGTLRAYRREEVQQVFESSRASTHGVPLALGSPCGARPITRPTTPTDREVNHYLQKTARPNTQTTPRGRRMTNQSYQLDYAVNVTPSLDLEISPERSGTCPSTFDSQPRTTPMYKTLTQKASLSVVTSKEPPLLKSPSTPTTPKTTPTKKKFRFTGSWGRKGSLPTEVPNSPCTLSGPDPKGSPPLGLSSFCRTPLTQTTYASSQSPRSPLQMIPVTQFHYVSPPQRTAPRTPVDEIPPIPPRNPQRLARTQSSTNFVHRSDSSAMACNASFPELQRESMLFFNQLDRNARTFYAEQKLNQLREFTDTRIVFHNMSDLRIDYMKHPNHNRVWESRNLRCRMHEGNCAVCYAACCIHESAEQTVKDVITLPEEKRNARKLLSEINMWYKTGEEPTFVDCSSCEKQVCPACAGVCSVCLKTTCKACDARLWQTCDTHFRN